MLIYFCLLFLHLKEKREKVSAIPVANTKSGWGGGGGGGGGGSFSRPCILAPQISDITIVNTM